MVVAGVVPTVVLHVKALISHWWNNGRCSRGIWSSVQKYNGVNSRSGVVWRGS